MADPRPNTDPLAAPMQVTSTPTMDGLPHATDPLYPAAGPDPSGTTPAGVQQAEAADASPATGVGTGGEEVMWEARYSMKNFIGRIAVRAGLALAWVALAVYTWGYGHPGLSIVTNIAGLVLLGLILALAFRIVQARYGHYYRLTNRRLFVSTGLTQRRRDQMELLRVKDVFTRQTLLERWLSIGSVVVVSDEKEIPTFYLSGVDDPKAVMDRVWHHARAERDNRSTKIDSV